MTEKELHDIRYINWRKESDFTMLTQQQWNQKIDELRENNAVEVLLGQRKNTVRSAWGKAEWSYSVMELEKVVKMCVAHVINRGKRTQKIEYSCYMVFKKEDKNEFFETTKKTSPGREAMEIIEKNFKERTELSLRKAFGYITKENEYEIIRHNAVAAPPLIYVVPSWVGDIYYHGYKADISSAYPDCLRGRLPDWHTVEIIPGRQEPTEEFPFVFWSDGHHAELNNYDTREFVNNKWFLATNDKDKDKLDNFKINGTLISYCCKASKFQLDNEMEKLYYSKETDIENKDHWKKMLVSFIGKMFEKRKDSQYPMPHLAAVCHGRQIKKMLELAAALEKEGNILISFATDSIIWCGKKSATTVSNKNKTLGSFVSEFENAEFAFGGVGVYALAKNGKMGIIKHQGRVSKEFENVKSLQQFLSVCKNKEATEYIGYDKKTYKFIPKWRI